MRGKRLFERMLALSGGGGSTAMAFSRGCCLSTTYGGGHFSIPPQILIDKRLIVWQNVLIEWGKRRFVGLSY